MTLICGRNECIAVRQPLSGTLERRIEAVRASRGILPNYDLAFRVQLHCAGTVALRTLPTVIEYQEISVFKMSNAMRPEKLLIAVIQETGALALS